MYQQPISPCRTWCSQPHHTCLASSSRSGRLPGPRCSPSGWCWDSELNTGVSSRHCWSNFCMAVDEFCFRHTPSHGLLPVRATQAQTGKEELCVTPTVQHWGGDETYSLLTALLGHQAGFSGDRSSSEHVCVHLVTWELPVEQAWLAGVVSTRENLWGVKLFPYWNERPFAFRFLKPYSFFKR